MTLNIQQLIFNLRNKPPVGEPITNEHLAQAANLIESLLEELCKEREEEEEEEEDE